MPIWNPWHGCHKISPGCQNCYVYRRDSSFGKDSSIVTKTADFDLPVRRDRFMDYKLRTTEEPVYTCMTSDFFVEEADVWREEAWAMMREREDLHFVIITKRIHRFLDCLPADWGDGYENVTIECTCENQEMTEQRLPLFLTYPIRHRKLIHEPMLGPIFIEDYLRTGLIEQVTCGGESGEAARICDYVWVLSVREQCVRNGVPFYFKQTGAKFRKDGRLYRIQRKDQMPQARKAEIDYAETEGLTAAGGLFGRLQHSEFRSRFALKEKEREYVQKKRHGGDSGTCCGVYFGKACACISRKRRKTDTDAGTSGFYRTACDSNLLPRMPGKMAWNSKGTQTDRNGTELYRIRDLFLD